MPDPEYHKRKGSERRTRFEQLSDQGSSAVDLPDVEHGAQIVEWLNELGMVEQGQNGPKPLSWQEINAWKEATGTAATAEELVIIRRLSSEYVKQYNVSDNPSARPPGMSEADYKVMVSKDLKAMIRGAPRLKQR